MCGVLDPTLNEVRVLNVSEIRGQASSDVLRCTLRKVSLSCLNPAFSDFLASGGHGPPVRTNLCEWTRSINPSKARNRHSLLRVPTDDLCRFSWGDFATLSYTWGDPEATESIIVNGQPWTVNRNLADALRVVRKLGWFSSQTYGLWADALCINQNDNEEQSAQVAVMRDIFAGSWTTISYLGQASSSSGQAISLLKTLAELWVSSGDIAPGELGQAQEDPEALGLGSWLATHDFFQRPFWTRLWVVQEMALAPHNMLMFAGNASITWREVQDAVSAIHVHFFYAKDVGFAHDRDSVLGGEAAPVVWDVRTLHHLYFGLARIVLKESLGEPRMSISELLETSSGTECKRNLDKVYGLLGVMAAEVANRVAVDYSLAEADVFNDVARLFIEAKGGFCNEIVRTATAWNKTGTASWAPDWTRPLVGRNMLKPLLPYEVEKGSTPATSISADGKRLTARGAMLDVIGIPSVTSWPESIPSVAIKHLAKLSARTALHRTLVGARGGQFGDRAWENNEDDVENPMCLFSLPSSFNEAMATFGARSATYPGWVRFAQQGALYEAWTYWRKSIDELLVQDFDGRPVSIRKLIGASELPPDEHCQRAFEEYYRFRETSSGRRFVTTISGKFGWAPEPTGSKDPATNPDSWEARPGDAFVLVFGCSVPLVIREFGQDWKILGEGYLDGVMDGEVMGLIDQGIIPVQDFCFV
ncbi:hypothetical protein LTS10_011794 [Elasticomyces elasticus]|nr:hypothetical protein LTS10_011794 [Elasticomyces elasticus]